MEHREALGHWRMSEKASRLVLCTEEQKGLPEREVMSKGAGTRNCRRVREEEKRQQPKANPGLPGEEPLSGYWRERQVEAVGHAAT